tara:strand:+ start:708 stop:1598 length:891 start_codon:yes stop_codon:yes gene_type:complete
MSETAQAEVPDNTGADVNPTDPEAVDAAPAQRYELDPEPDNDAESPPAEEEVNSLDKKADDTEAPKDENKVQKRIDKLTKRWRDAERHNQELAAELEQQRLSSEAAQKLQEPAKTLADFNYDENQYREYLHSEVIDVAKAEAGRVAQDIRAQAEAAEQTARWDLQEREFAKTHTDYDEIAKSPDLNISQDMATEIQAAENGPAIAYHLGQHPELASEISTLPPREVTRRIARLEVALESAREATQEQQVSKAPPPPPKVKATSPGLRVASTSPDSDKLSDRDWLRRRQAELAKRGL